MASVNDVTAQYWQHPVQWSTAALSAGTLAAGLITGAAITVLNTSGATPGTQTTRTATLMIADASLHMGYTWLLIIFNSVTTNTLTLAAGGGVTLAGTTTVLPFSARLYSCTVNSTTTPAITITGTFSFGTVGGTALSSIA